jgi:hypothetical protein
MAVAADKKAKCFLMSSLRVGAGDDESLENNVERFLGGGNRYGWRKVWGIL